MILCGRQDIKIQLSLLLVLLLLLLTEVFTADKSLDCCSSMSKGGARLLCFAGVGQLSDGCHTVVLFAGITERGDGERQAGGGQQVPLHH